jgi:hypothetical protein
MKPKTPKKPRPSVNHLPTPIRQASPETRQRVGEAVARERWLRRSCRSQRQMMVVGVQVLVGVRDDAVTMTLFAECPPRPATAVSLSM